MIDRWLADSLYVFYILCNCTTASLLTHKLLRRHFILFSYLKLLYFEPEDNGGLSLALQVWMLQPPFNFASPNEQTRLITLQACPAKHLKNKKKYYQVQILICYTLQGTTKQLQTYSALYCRSCSMRMAMMVCLSMIHLEAFIGPEILRRVSIVHISLHDLPLSHGINCLYLNCLHIKYCSMIRLETFPFKLPEHTLLLCNVTIKKENRNMWPLQFSLLCEYSNQELEPVLFE